MKQTVTNLKQLIRAGRGIIPAHTVILNGSLVNVMTSEVYKADVAIYEDTIVAVGAVSYTHIDVYKRQALDGKSADVALLAGPTAYKAKQQGYNLVTNGKGLTDAVIAVAVREDFYNEHKEEVELFIKAQERIVKYMNENYDETMEIVAKELDLDKSAVEEMYKQYDFSIETTEMCIRDS